MASTARVSIHGRSTAPPQAKAVKFCFPVLSAKEIQEFFVEHGTECDTDELVKTRPDTVRALYEVLLQQCLGIDKSELLAVHEAGAEALKHPELHEESVPTMNFYRLMCVAAPRATALKTHSLVLSAAGTRC